MRTFTTIICALLFISVATSQDTTDTTAIPSENVEVIKNYEASIAQASKKAIHIETRTVDHPPIQYQYKSSIPKAIDFDRPDPVIRAMAYKDKDQVNQDIKDGTIYGAYGNLNTIKAGAAYHYYIEDWLEAGLDFKHFSAKDDQINPAQKYYHTSGELYAGYYFNPNTKIRLSGLLDFDRNYSNHPDADTSNVLIRHPFDQQTFKLDFSHVAFENLGLSIRSSAGYDNLKHLDAQISEKSLFGELNIYKKINDKVAFELPARFSRTDLISEVDIEDEKLFNEFTTTPALHIKHDKYLLNAGVRFFKGYERTIIFPDVRLNLNKLFSGFDLGIEVFSEIDRVSLSMFKNENPFSTVSLSTSSNYLQPYGRYRYVQNYKLGLNKELGIHQFNFSSTYRRFDEDNIYNFNKFYNLYNMDIVKRSELIFNLNYSIFLRSGLTLKSDISYTHFLDDFFPSYLAKWNGAITLDKRFGSKFDVGFKAIFLSSRSILVSVAEDPGGFPTIAEYDMNIDLGVYLKYRISPAFNIFVESSNLLASTDYAIWYDNPVLERQVWGGLQFNF